MSRPIPQPARALFSLLGVAIRRGWMPAPGSATRPHDVRIAHRHPQLLTGKPDLSVTTTDGVVDGRGGPIAVRVYTPPGITPDAPAILFLHGGGFIDGGLDFTDNVQRGLASRTGFVVVGASYRLAPEHPFPAALEDCEDAYRWMVSARPAGLDPTRIAVAGESAGGNLTGALCLLLKGSDVRQPVHQTLVYPFTDTTLFSTDWDTVRLPGIDRRAGERMVEVYAGEAHRDNPLVSILHADLSGLPPAMVVTCEHDVLRTDGIKYAEALTAAGVPTVHRHYDNMPHGYLLVPGILREARRSLDEIAAEISRFLG